MVFRPNVVRLAKRDILSAAFLDAKADCSGKAHVLPARMRQEPHFNSGIPVFGDEPADVFTTGVRRAVVHDYHLEIPVSLVCQPL